jgi:hypothetical protein
MAIDPHILLLLYDTTRWESCRAPYPSLPAVRSSDMVLHAEAHRSSEDHHCAVVGYFVHPQKRVRRRLGERRRGAADFVSLLQKEETCFCGGCSSRRMFICLFWRWERRKWVFIGAVMLSVCPFSAGGVCIPNLVQCYLIASVSSW